ncbi:DUF6504 family protein [Alicyclobacillus ferrooxydans]|uniref:DUF6504 family protein n=1 Tax=Alicyclobacillus ferrooxydans TaxID=471514 RepID=UPI000B1C687E
MTRLIRREVSVVLSQGDDTPASFLDGSEKHKITEVVDCWRESGEWWNGEPPRQIWRVFTDKNGFFDLEQVGDAWSIYRVWD